MSRLFMYYHTPPSEWMEGLPIGNGRLAAMVWGDAPADRLTLNHEWLWTGCHRDRQCEDAAGHLEEVRGYIERAEWEKAAETGNRYFGGNGGLLEGHNLNDTYQPAGELIFKPDGVRAFTGRSLDLETGLAKTFRELEGELLSGEFFVSCTDGLIHCRWRSDVPFSGTLSLVREPVPGTSVTLRAEPGLLRLSGSVSGGISFAAEVRLTTDGAFSAGKEELRVENATVLTAEIDLAASFSDLEEELEPRRNHPADFSAAFAAHSQRFRSFMDRLRLELAPSDPELEALPTDERIQKVKEGGTDNGICLLYFHYGRYLLLSSSICGELPANLQGKWNDMMDPPWDSDYHFDINIEMNYWMAEAASLPECIDALTRYIQSFEKSAREAAMRLYGCRGILLPLQTDAWGISTPEANGWAVWVGAAPWIARTFWDHWRYGGSREFLREIYPFFAGVAEFYEDYLVRDAEGIYQILPSQSPENFIEGLGGWPVFLGKSSAMDVQLCYDALGYAISAAEELEVDKDRAERWKSIRDHLPPFAIGSDGRLLEWDRELPEGEPGHRHLSHLYGVYPSDLFTPNTRTEQYQAAIRSLRFRLSHGGGHTGWSRTWVACLEARLGNAEEFYKHFTALIKDFATVSLLDLHPPRLFQIDGNLGEAAAVLEALVSFYDGKAHLLPALPAQWHTGSLEGVRIPGGHTLSLKWENGELTSLEAEIGFSGTMVLVYRGEEQTVSGKPGDRVRIR